MSNTKIKGNKSGIKLPPRVGINSMVPDKDTVEFAQQQLNRSSSTPDEMTPEMRSFVNEVAAQKKADKAPRINEKKSNEVYSSQPIAIERSDLKEIDVVLKKIPTSFGKKRPDFNQQDYIRMAVKNQLKRDRKKVKKGVEIFYSRHSERRS